MSTANLSVYDPGSVPNASEMRFGIVVSDWNREVTWSLLEGAVKTLKKYGAKDIMLIEYTKKDEEMNVKIKFITSKSIYSKNYIFRKSFLNFILDNKFIYVILFLDK